MPGSMTSIGQIISDQPGIIPQITVELNYERLWAANVFVDHYYDYCYNRLMRGTSSEEKLKAKEAYEHL